MLAKGVLDWIICKLWNDNITAFVVFRIGLQNPNRLRPIWLKTLYDVNRLYRGLFDMYNCKIVLLYGMINLSIVFLFHLISYNQYLRKNVIHINEEIVCEVCI